MRQYIENRNMLLMDRKQLSAKLFSDRETIEFKVLKKFGFQPHSKVRKTCGRGRKVEKSVLEVAVRRRCTMPLGEVSKLSDACF